MPKISIIKLVGAGLVAIAAGCASMAPNDGSATDHPVPATSSIIPLQTGNIWKYYYQMFDSSENKISFPEDTLILKITGVYRRTGDTLQEIDGWVDVNEVEKEEFIYRYEWDRRDSGYLVNHKATGILQQRGLYIVGEFQHNEWQLYDTARLWYSYPCNENFSWEVLLPGGGRDISFFKCVSKSDSAWIKEMRGSSLNPVIVVSGCYIYKQETEGYTYYHQFHPDYGKISLRGYKNGVLRESYYLVDWNVSKR